MSKVQMAQAADRAYGPHSVLDQIGNTPLIRLEKVGAELANVEIYAKAEYFNPGGSVKDRPALNMIRRGNGQADPQEDDH